MIRLVDDFGERLADQLDGLLPVHIVDQHGVGKRLAAVFLADHVDAILRDQALQIDRLVVSGILLGGRGIRGGDGLGPPGCRLRAGHQESSPGDRRTESDRTSSARTSPSALTVRGTSFPSGPGSVSTVSRFVSIVCSLC